MHLPQCRGHKLGEIVADGFNYHFVAVLIFTPFVLFQINVVVMAINKYMRLSYKGGNPPLS